jgi:signal transduction histidine kinase
MATVGDELSEREHARFERVRLEALRSLFSKLGQWRILWLQPLLGGLLVMLLVEHASTTRIVAQALILAVSIVVTLLPLGKRLESGDTTIASRGFLIFSFCLAASIINTGATSSPLVTGVFPVMIGAWLHPALLAGFPRRAFFWAVIVFLAIAGVISYVAPLPPAMASTTSYRLIEWLTVVASTVGVFVVCQTVASAYERFAREIARDREQLYRHTADHTRTTEAVGARLAHEIKNPLAVIRALSASAAKRARVAYSEAEHAKLCERMIAIAHEAERLQSIVDGTLSYSQSLDELQVARINVFEVLRDLATLFEPNAMSARVTIQIEGSREIMATADATKLRQALHNLIANALEASRENSTVQVLLGVADAFVRIAIVDHGRGMSPEVLDRLERPFYSTKKNGSGLGIMIARAIVKQHGGTLRFESRAGLGTTAVVMLRREAANDRSESSTTVETDSHRDFEAKMTPNQPDGSTRERVPLLLDSDQP